MHVTVKTFGTLRVNAALVKSVYCIMEYTIFNLVIHALEFWYTVASEKYTKTFVT